MRYTTFGRNTGLRVSELALGTGNFGTGWGYGSEKEEARAVFDGFANAGGNFIDTADTYQTGQSEELVGDFNRLRSRSLCGGHKVHSERPAGCRRGTHR